MGYPGGRDDCTNPGSPSCKSGHALGQWKRLYPQNILIDLQSLRLIDFYLIFVSTAGRLLTVLGVLLSMFGTSARVIIFLIASESSRLKRVQLKLSAM